MMEKQAIYELVKGTRNDTQHQNSAPQNQSMISIVHFSVCNNDQYQYIYL